jgi:hypothetical protein
MCLIRSVLSISKHSHCLIDYYTVPNLLPVCTEYFSSARSSPSQSDSHCLIYLFLRQFWRQAYLSWNGPWQFGAWSSACPQDPSSVSRTCPLALEACILELEWPWLSLSLASTSWIPPLENLDKSVHMPRTARLQLPVIVATVTCRLSLSTLAPGMIQVQPFSSH